MQIQGGNNPHNTANVDGEGNLRVFAIQRPEERHANDEGRVCSVHFNVTPAGANDLFLYFKNTGTKDVSITDMSFSSTVPTNIHVMKVSGTPTYVTGTTPSLVNRNLGSTLAPNVDVKYDTDITGLVESGVIFFQECPVADTLFPIKSPSNIIIPQGSSLALKRIEATGNLEVLLTIVEV